MGNCTYNFKKLNEGVNCTLNNNTPNIISEYTNISDNISSNSSISSTGTASSVDSSNKFSSDKINFKLNTSSHSCKYQKYFDDFNIIDNKNNIVLGIWNNPNKSNTLGNQGIWIGNQEKIFQLTFAVYHKCLNYIMFIFEDNIRLKIFKHENSNDIRYELKCKSTITNNPIEVNIIKKIKKIDSDSEDIDLIFKLIENIKSNV